MPRVSIHTTASFSNSNFEVVSSVWHICSRLCLTFTTSFLKINKKTDVYVWIANMRVWTTYQKRTRNNSTRARVAWNCRVETQLSPSWGPTVNVWRPSCGELFLSWGPTFLLKKSYIFARLILCWGSTLQQTLKQFKFKIKWF